MNKVYKSVWCDKTGTYVATSETTRSNGKKRSGGTVRAAMAAGAMAAVFGVAKPVLAWTVNPAYLNNGGTAASDGGMADNIAIGDSAVSTATDGTANRGIISIGVSAKALSQNAMAIGEQTSVESNGSTAIGAESSVGVNSANSVAIGTWSSVKDNSYGGTAIGPAATAQGKESTAIGANSSTSATHAVAIGFVSQAVGTSSTAIGSAAVANGADSLAMGSSATANAANSVALGSNSVTGNSIPGAGGYDPTKNSANLALAGTVPIGEVSIGSAGKERRLTNVAAGQNATDAVNVSQLRVTTTKLDQQGFDVATGLGGSSWYDPATGHLYTGLNVNGNPFNNVQSALGYVGQGWSLYANGANPSKVLPGGSVNFVNGSNTVASLNGNTLKVDVVNNPTFSGMLTANGGLTVGAGQTVNMGGNRVTNVAAGTLGSASTDAVNGSQLFQTNQNVANVDNKVTQLGNVVNNFAGDQSTTFIQQNGGGIRYVRTNDAGMPQTDAYAQGQLSTAVGYNATAQGDNSLALGANSFAQNAGDVALGSGSKTAGAVATAGTTIAGDYYTFAGTTPLSTVSVGDVGAERTITNVAAGRVTGSSTDAINGSQLYATNQAVEKVSKGLANLDAGAVKYDKNADGTINYNSVTMGGTTYDTVNKTGGTTITNVARGVNDSDAVNMSQLNETNATINNFAGDQSTTYTTINGRGIRYVRTNDAGMQQTDAYAQGVLSTAVGYSATAKGANSVAMGANSVAQNDGDVALGAGAKTAAAVGTTGITIAGNQYKFAGTAPVSTVSVGDLNAERTITNVAAGQVTASSTDAINGSQLFATNQAIEKLDAGAVKYDKNGDGSVNYNSVTMGGPVSTDGGVTGGTTITNVHQGAVTATSTDAINGAQLYDIAGDTSNTYINKNGRGVKYVRTNDTGLVASDASAQGQGSSAVGYNATAVGESALALGRNAVASEANSVALGAGAVTAAAVATTGTTIAGNHYDFAGTAPTSTVSVGSAGVERTITNVAAGRVTAASTDAVNGSQLYATNQAIETLNKGTVQYEKKADGTYNYNSVTMAGDTYNSETKSGGTAIHNVARGVQDGDAVNMSQLKDMGKKVDGVQRNANAGSASAMALAGLPQSVLPGKGMMAIAASSYGGEAAMALGVSKLSDSGKWVLKGGLTSNTRGNVGATVGAGFHW